MRQSCIHEHARRHVGSRMSRLAAIVVVAITAVFLAMDLILGSFDTFFVVPLALLPFPVVGALLIARVPRNPVGYLLSLSGLLFASVFALSIYAQAALVSAPGSLPWGDVAAAVSDAAFIPAVACVVLMLLFFPSGRGLGGRWTWIEVALIAFVVALSLGGLFNDKTIEIGYSGEAVVRIQNPLAIHGPLAGVIAFFAALGDPSVVVVLLGPLSLFVRYRRSSPIERQQIKWLAYSATLVLVLLVASNIAPAAVSDSAWPVVMVAFGLIPITIGIAILRYRLYDIDVLIRRTLVYATLSAVLLGAYVAVVALLETFLAPITAGNGIAVAVSTLAVVALFQPVRRRVQTAVDQRFYRPRYSAERTLDRFATRLRDQVDIDALERELLAAVGETVHPSHASVWLRSND
jgi:hypothetical protein